MTKEDTIGKAPPPAHQQVYGRLRDMILFGDLAPGQAVTIQGLVADLGAGMTPVREALRRLTAEGALVFQGNRRITVPVLTQSDLEQVAFLRGALEPELARRACAKASPEGIEQLTHLDSALDHAITLGDVHGYLRGNYDFHAALYAMAQAPMLAGQVDALWLRFGPSLRNVLADHAPAELPDQHKHLLHALKTKDTQAAARAIAADVAQGVDRLQDGLT